MAIRAGLVPPRAGLALPQRFAVQHRQGCGIAGVVVLHRLGGGAHVVVAGAALVERDFGGGDARQQNKRKAGHSGRAQRGLESMKRDALGSCTGHGYGVPGSGGPAVRSPGMTSDHSTTIFASSVTSKPLSPIHRNASVPLSVATVWKVMNGLAAIAGNSCVAKISSPLYRHENDVMMSRGMSRPLVPARKPDSHRVADQRLDLEHLATLGLLRHVDESPAHCKFLMADPPGTRRASRRPPACRTSSCRPTSRRSR